MDPVLVLVGTDFSDGAKAALLSGRMLASRLGGEVMVMHVFDPPGGAAAEYDEDARRWMYDCDINHLRVITRRGMAWLELTREARSRDAAVIVIGRHGRSGCQPIKLGSTASRVGLAAHCPVLLVGERTAGRTLPKFWHGSTSVRPLHT